MADCQRPGDARPQVLQIVGSLGRGGAENVVVGLCNTIAQARFDVSIVSLSDSIPLAARLTDVAAGRVVTCGQTPNVLSLGNQIRTAYVLRRIVRSRRPAIIHSHLYGANAPLQWIAAVGGGAKHVVTIHTDGLHYAPTGNWLLTLLRYVEAANLRLCGAEVVAVSRRVAEVAKRRLNCPASRVHVIGNGVDASSRFMPCSSKAAAKIRLGFDANAPLAVCVASFHAHKGHSALLHAWSNVVQREPEARLMLVGDGPLRPKMTALAVDLGIVNHVRFFGERDDVPGVIAAADVGVCPSLFEGFGLAPAEIMASGVALVVSDVPGLRELIGDPPAALSVRVGDADALAAAICSVISNPEMAVSLGGKGRARVVERFSLAAQARSYENLYASLLSGRAPNIR